MNTENPTTTQCNAPEAYHPGFPCQHAPSTELDYTGNPDYGIWTRAVERAMEALEDQGVELEFYPSEGLIAAIVADLGLTSPDEGAQMQILEDELIAIFGDE